MYILVFGADVSTRCGRRSNVDFIYFFWQNFECISSKLYAIIPIPSDITSLSTLPRILCLKYYRAASDGWKDAANCDTCVEMIRRYTFIPNWSKISIDLN